MKAAGWIAVGVLALLGVVTLASSAYVVREWEQVVVTEFGKPVGEPITEAGLHFKTPFLQTARRFDKRLQSWDGERNEVPTADKRFIWVDTMARWRIADPLLFLETVRDESGAQSRLDDILDAAVRDQISSHNVLEVVRISNRVLEETDAEDRETASTAEYLEPIEVGRNEITKRILEAARPVVRESFGIDLVDLRIKRINYTESVRQKVYERMRSERERIAEQFRSEGQGLMAEIQGRMQREEKRITSEAYRKAQEVVAKADAEAATIFAQTYDRDPEFYAFLRSLEVYRATVGENHTLVISPDSDLYRYLFSPGRK